MICGREETGIGKSSTLLTGRSPALSGGGAFDRPWDERSPLSCGLDRLHLVLNGFVDGRARAAENVTGHLPCGSLPDAAEAFLALLLPGIAPSGPTRSG